MTGARAGAGEGGSQPSPFRREGARLRLEDVELTEIAHALEGRAVWLVSDARVRAALERWAGLAVPLDALGPPALLRLAAQAGCWAAVASVHELDLALEAGFASERCCALGRVKDDGFVVDAVTRGVGVLSVHDADDAANVARIAALLDLSVPPATGAPERMAPGAFAGCGGLLAAVLRCDETELWIDAPLPQGVREQDAPLEVLCVESESESEAEAEAEPAREVVLRGWSRGGTEVALRARLAGRPRRGEAVVVCLDDVLSARAVDPVHVTPDVVLVHGHLWRPLERRDLPPPPPES